MGEDRAVRIMTIHKCKGLEFHSVILLAVEKEAFFGDPEDERKAFFVGVSRAKKRLFLSVADRRPKWPRAPWWWNETRRCTQSLWTMFCPSLKDHKSRSEDIAAFDQQTKEQTQAEARLRELNAAIPQLEINLRTAVAVHEQEKGSLAAEEKRQEALRMLWDEVSELDKVVAAARESLAQASEQRKQVDQQATAADEAKAVAVEEQKKLEAEIAAASVWFGEHSVDADISAKRAELQAAFARWSGAEKQHTTAQQSLAIGQKEFERFTALSREAHDKLGPLETALETKKKSVEQAHENLTTQNQGRTLADIESSKDASQQRRNQLERLSEIATKLRQLTAALAEKQLEGQQIAAALTNTTTECAALTQRRDEGAKLVEARQATLLFAERLQSLEAHRAALTEGAPCPLCGATDHPFALPDAVLPVEIVSARDNLAAANKELKRAQENLTQGEKTRSGVLADQNRIAGEITRLQGEHKIAAGLWDTNSRDLHLDCTFENDSGIKLIIADSFKAEDRLTQQVAAVRKPIGCRAVGRGGSILRDLQRLNLHSFGDGEDAVIGAVDLVPIQVRSNTLKMLARALGFWDFGGIGFHGKKYRHIHRAYTTNFPVDFDASVSLWKSETFKWWRYGDSNPRPSHCERELRAPATGLQRSLAISSAA
jgi:hypothetical protein